MHNTSVKHIDMHNSYPIREPVGKVRCASNKWAFLQDIMVGSLEVAVELRQGNKLLHATASKRTSQLNSCHHVWIVV